jgi:hypothetical protein
MDSNEMLLLGQEAMGEDQMDPRTLRLLLEQRANELFKLCDVEDKGFINKKDIQRMRESTGMSPELLEEVFDSLDSDHNGFLTIDEFTIGFSRFLGAPVDDDDNADDMNGYRKTDDSLIGLSAEQQEEEEIFRETMESLGAGHLIDRFVTFFKGFSSFCYNHPE